jgi:hypothetical protein
MSREERRVGQQVRDMTKKEIILKAIEGKLTWVQAAMVLRMTDRHLRRLRARYEKYGFDGLQDHRGKTPRRTRIPLTVVRELLRLKRDVYPDLNMTHFHEKVTEKHGVELSYTWTRHLLEAAGLVEKAPGRGQYRRARERRPMRGMLVHMDGSTHAWLPDLPMRDLIVTLDDATSEILDMRMVEQEGTASTFAALEAVLSRFGRFCDLYTDRGSHFRPTQTSSAAESDGQVSRALRVLGIGQIFARSPQARGRSERMFQTLQGRLPQELRLAGVRRYDDPRLATVLQAMTREINNRFAVAPAQPESAFVPLVKTPLRLLLCPQHDRIVNHDHTVHFDRLVLQLPPGKTRVSYARCPVLVHEFSDGTLGVSHHGSLLASFDRKGGLLSQQTRAKRLA